MYALCHKDAILLEEVKFSHSTHRKFEFWDWGAGSGSKVLATESWEPELVPTTPALWKQSQVSPKLTGQSAKQNHWEIQSQEIRRLRKISNMAPGFCTQIHMHQHPCACTGTHIHTKNSLESLSTHRVINNISLLLPYQETRSEYLTGLIWCASCEGDCNCCSEVISERAVSCLDDSTSYILPASSFMMFPEPCVDWWRGEVGVSIQQLLTLSTLTNYTSLHQLCPLHRDAALMKVENSTNLWV